MHVPCTCVKFHAKMANKQRERESLTFVSPGEIHLYGPSSSLSGWVGSDHVDVPWNDEREHLAATIGTGNV